MAKRVEITSLGSKGDGITADGRILPFTLPGEIIDINRTGGASIIKSSPYRIKPVCRHFGKCGGCSLQHFEQTEYLKWKRQLVVDAFDSEGLKPAISDCLPVATGTRRRATFSAKSTIAGTLLGFQARRSHEIIDLEECPVLSASISGRVGILRQLAGLLQPKSDKLKIAVLSCGNGLDVVLKFSGSIGSNRRNALIRWALDNRIARLTCNDEIILQTTHPVLTVAGAEITPPPGNFAQAVSSVEQQLADLVGRHLKNCGKVVDLFAGFGAFALHLSKNSNVHAVEIEQSALNALKEAAGKISGIRQIATERRDLLRRPILSMELSAYNGAVFNPPRAGAEMQATELAGSVVDRIAAVSCNPATLARDAKILVDGGYRISKVIPIDQFLYSPHVEIVALLERKRVREGRKIFG